MAGLVPRLSGSRHSSSWRESGGRKPCRVFSVHEVGAHEWNEFEEAAGFFGDLLQCAQKKKGDQGDGDLDAARRFPTGRRTE
jgi:hypothetical protein